MATDFCPHCGAPRAAAAQFCTKCGTGLPAVIAPQTPTGPGLVPPGPASAGTPGWSTSPPRASSTPSRGFRIATVVLAVIATVGLGVLASQGQLNMQGLPAGGGLVTVTYHLAGTARGASITYTDGSGNIQQQTSVSVPLTRESDGGDGLQIRTRRGSFVTILAQNSGDSGDLTCSIEAEAWP